MSQENGLKNDDKERISSLFEKLDLDKDGHVSISELAKVIKGVNPHSDAIQEVAKKIIKQGKMEGNSVEPSNFPTMTLHEFINYVKDTETQLKLSFHQLDKNNDKVVDAEEIRQAMLELGVNIGINEANKLIKKMDKDGSFSIDYEEWRDFLLFSGNSEIGDIFRYWRKASALDIGEVATIPDDYTDEEKKAGVVWRTLLAGGLAGCISRSATAPLDRIKVIWQTRGIKASSVGIFASFKTMLREGGLISMWRGNGVNCVKIAPESGIKFLAYEVYKQMLFPPTTGSNRQFTLSEKFIAGALSGATSQTIIYPLEVLKTRMCIRKTGQYSSMFDCARKLYSANGWRVFYRGYLPNIVGILPYAGLDLALYETFKNSYAKFVKSTGQHEGQKENLTSQQTPVYVTLLAGALSSVCGQVATYPVALVKTKLQAQSGQLLVRKLIKDILVNEGFKGLYRGIGPNMLKVIPAVSISYASYDKIRGFLGIHN